MASASTCSRRCIHATRYPRATHAPDPSRLVSQGDVLAQVFSHKPRITLITLCASKVRSCDTQCRHEHSGTQSSSVERSRTQSSTVEHSRAQSRSTLFPPPTFHSPHFFLNKSQHPERTQPENLLKKNTTRSAVHANLYPKRQPHTPQPKLQPRPPNSNR